MAHPLYTTDPNDLPRYTLRETAHYLLVPESTLKSWVSGRRYVVASGPRFWQPLIARPDRKDSRLSFSNLIEAHVLSALRKQYRVRIDEIRTALEYACKQLGVERVLLSKELRVMIGNIFLQHPDKLINVGKGGQEAMPEILQAYLERIEWDVRGVPTRMYPLTRFDYRNAPRFVTIDPVVAFGRPVIERKAIKTSVIAERFKAGESIEEIAEDYDLEAFEIEEAVRYEALPLAA
ncbi:MAG TPA: DUF433 domain-containing protein [Thermoanaerobaculia bacterium]|nr:DUF433 domain-containing protein [Thermoanaerobaculia bacterium]